MYNAQLTVATGYGVDRYTVNANNYNTLMDRVAQAIAWIEKPTLDALGKVMHCHVERVVYNYPSGKKFVKNF